MKNRILKQFTIKKNNAERKGEISLISIIFVMAIGFFISTSGFFIDKGISDGFGRAMMNTSGGGNKLIRGGGTYFDLEPYKYPFIFVSIMVFIILESWLKMFKEKHPKNGLSRQNGLMLTFEIVVSSILMAVVGYMQYESYAGGGEFGKNFYIGTMAGKDIVGPAYIISSLVMTTTQGVLVGYVHAVLAKRRDFSRGGYGELALFTAAFFLLVNYLYVNGLKGVFNRPYEVNLRGGDGTEKISEIYPRDKYPYLDAYVESNEYGGYVTKPGDDLFRNYPSNLEFPGYKINKQIGQTVGVSALYLDAFPSGHMNCALFLCASLFVLFRNPQTKKEHVIARIMIAVGTGYVLNMAIILEYTGSHGLSDMSFSLITMPIMYLMGMSIGDGIENMIMKGVHGNQLM